MSHDLLLVTAGLALLVAGAEGLVRGAVSLATRFRISPLVIGLTVVAFGTSAPEVAVSIGAAGSSQGSLALGNVVGSNVFNILMILGLSAVLAPLRVEARLVRIDVPLMLAAVVLPVLLALDGRLGPWDGALLLGALAAYLLVLGRLARSEQSEGAAGEYGVLGWIPSLALGLGGLGILVLGADFVVAGAVGVARAIGVSELVIGLTVVAVGTSLPELATSLIATRRDQRDLAVGNVVGSNVFNALGVLGAGALAGGAIDVPVGVFMLDFPVMIGVSVACLPVFLSGANINRAEGFTFVAFYVLYTTYLGLHATDHALHDEFGIAVLGVILPLTLAVGGALYARGKREERRHARPGESRAG